MIKTLSVAFISAKEKANSMKDWKDLIEKQHDFITVKLNTDDISPENTKEIGESIAANIKDSFNFNGQALLSVCGKIDEVKKSNGKIKLKAAKESYFAITPVKNAAEVADAVAADCSSILADAFKRRAFTEGVWKD